MTCDHPHWRKEREENHDGYVRDVWYCRVCGAQVKATAWRKKAT